MTDRAWVWFVIAFLIVFWLLTGCATQTPPPTVIGAAPVTVVKVPVVEPCIRPEDIPAIPPSAMPPAGSSIVGLTNGAAADVLTLAEHSRKLDALLRACSLATPKEKTP